MKQQIRKTLSIIVLMLCVVFSNAQEYEPYFTLDEMPDAGVFLPPPPDFESVAFVDDFMQWQWGLSVRPSDRGQMASQDSRYGIERMAEIYGGVLGVSISQEETPAIWRLMSRAGITSRLSITKAKKKYMRIRPFVKMNEHTFGAYDDEEELRYNGSYPSGHTSFAWSVALALSEMAPEYQDSILHRGYQYGESRVIVGAHWQSDVDAAFLAMAAAVARLHTSDEFLQDMKDAQREYHTIKRLDMTNKPFVYPNGMYIMDAFCDTVSCRYYIDVLQYWIAKSEREGDRGIQAIMNADISDEAFMEYFAPCLGIPCSMKETPCIAMLLSNAKQIFLQGTSQLKSDCYRKRPFVQFGETSLVPENEAESIYTSSYPSASATMGWGLALVLSEIDTEHQNLILQKGYEFGRSCVISGYNYASDVQASRILASCIYTQMHNDTLFNMLLNGAKTEYQKLSAKSKNR